MRSLKVFFILVTCTTALLLMPSALFAQSCGGALPEDDGSAEVAEALGLMSEAADLNEEAITLLLKPCRWLAREKTCQNNSCSESFGCQQECICKKADSGSGKVWKWKGACSCNAEDNGCADKIGDACGEDEYIEPDSTPTPEPTPEMIEEIDSTPTPEPTYFPYQ